MTKSIIDEWLNIIQKYLTGKYVYINKQLLLINQIELYFPSDNEGVKFTNLDLLEVSQADQIIIALQTNLEGIENNKVMNTHFKLSCHGYIYYDNNTFGEQDEVSFFNIDCIVDWILDHKNDK